MPRTAPFRFGLLSPLAVALIERSCRDNQMHMRVVIEIAFMGM
jgi:hypothetical protein